MKENPYDPPTSGPRNPQFQQGQNTLPRFYIGMLVLALMMGLVIWHEGTIRKLGPVIGNSILVVGFSIPLIAWGVTITLAEKRFANISGRDAFRRVSAFLLAAILLTFVGCIFFVSTCTGAMLFADSAFPAGGRSYSPSNQAWAIALSVALFVSNALVFRIYNRCRGRFDKPFDR